MDDEPTPIVYEKWNYLRDPKPICKICKKRFKLVGENKWEGNCPHHKGRVVEW